MKSDAMLSPLGIALRTLRRDAGLTGVELSTALGWNRNRAGKYERGDFAYHGNAVPSNETLERWAEVCGRPGQAEHLIELAQAERKSNDSVRLMHAENRALDPQEEQRGVELEVRNPGHCWLCTDPAEHRGYCEKHYRQALRGISEGETRSIRVPGYRRADGTFVHEYYSRRPVRSKPDLVPVTYWKTPVPCTTQGCKGTVTKYGLLKICNTCYHRRQRRGASADISIDGRKARHVNPVT